jgi:nitrogen fixation NifU-like protein
MDQQSAIDLILDHYEHPRHYGPLDNASLIGEGTNAGCGDVIRLYVQLDAGGRIVDISFEGQGCTISRATASILTEIALGRPLEEIKRLDYEVFIPLLGQALVASRTRCVMLALDALKTAVPPEGQAGL